jgi:hypothetical protein
VLLFFIGLFAMMGQLTVAIAPLAEGRDARLASHVEASGTTGHHSHDATKCVFCQTHVLRGTVQRPELPVVLERSSAGVVIAAVGRATAATYNPQANPRAPPVVI